MNTKRNVSTKHRLGTFFSLILLFFSLGALQQTQASIFFDFVCDSSDCNGVAPLEGYWELSDTALVPNERRGSNSGEIIDFHFKIGLETFNLSNADDPLSGQIILISNDGSFLEGLYQGGPSGLARRISQVGCK
jgi:hypothetical protein